MGRFMSPDWSAEVDPVPYARMGDPQSLNLYAYVANAPLAFVDPTGHQSGGNDVVLGGCPADGGAPFECYMATIEAQEPSAPMRLFHLPDDPDYSASVSGIGGGCSMSDARCQLEYENWYNSNIGYYANQRKTLVLNSGPGPSYTHQDVCAASALLHKGVPTLLDAAGLIPLEGRVIKGGQFVASVASAGLNIFTSTSAPADAALSAASVGVAGVDDAKVMTTGAEAVPIVGIGVSILATGKDLHEMGNYYNDCLAGKN